jgi:hypothetical protein
MAILVPADFNLKGYIISKAEEKSTTLIPYMDRKIELLLRDTFGHVMYEEFVAGLLAETPKWLDIRDGKTYVIGTETYRWKGLKEALRPYICSTWLYDDITNVSDNGTSIAKQENEEKIDPIHQIVTWHNEFVFCFGYRCSKVDSLYGFLTYDKELYPTLKWKAPKPLNVFGL